MRPIRTPIAIPLLLPWLLTHCTSLPTVDDPAGAAASAEQVPTAATQESYAGASPQLVRLARIEGHGDPQTGQLWMRLQPQAPAADARDGVAGQSQALGYCAVDEERWGEVDFDPDTHPARAFEFYTVPEPGGCEDNDHDGVPDDDPAVCNDGNRNGVAFNAFSPVVCGARVPSGADDRVIAELGGGADTHATVFGLQGVGCAQQHVGNHSGRNYARVYLDIDIFNGTDDHKPYGFPYGQGDLNVGAAPTPGEGRARPSQADGLWDLGPLDSGQSVRTWVFFRNGDPTNFSFTGYLLGEVTEVCGTELDPDGVDDDCDGVADNGCGFGGYGDSCYVGSDCRSDVCDGADPSFSLLGAAAVPGSSTLADDVPGSCGAACGDALIEGDEQCDDVDGTPLPGDGCSETCTVESGYPYPLWGPVVADYMGRADEATALTRDGDGWVMAARSEAGGDSDWALVRATGAGMLDTAWGNGGFSDVVEFAPDDADEEPVCVGRRSDGSFIAVGDGAGKMAMAAWDASGALMWSQLLPIGGANAVDCMVVGDDRLLVVGESPGPSSQDVRAIMFTANGAPDPAWAMGTVGVSGIGWIEPAPAASIVDGEGFSIDGVNYEFDFDGPIAGDVAVDLVGAVTAEDVAARIAAAIGAHDQGFVVSHEPGTRLIIFAHLGPGTAVGTETVASVDFMYVPAVGGSVMWDLGGMGNQELVDALAPAPGDRVVVGGTTMPGSDPWVARFNGNGTLDTTFNSGDTPGYQHLGDGVGTVEDLAANMMSIFVVGSSGVSNGWAAHLTPMGVVTQLVATPGDILDTVIIDGDGRGVVVGERVGVGLLMSRRMPGTLAADPSFHNGTNLLLPGGQTAFGLAFDVGGEIMAAGLTSGQDVLLVRIAP